MALFHPDTVAGLDIAEFKLDKEMVGDVILRNAEWIREVQIQLNPVFIELSKLPATKYCRGYTSSHRIVAPECIRLHRTVLLFKV